MAILGLNTWFHDTSACLVVDGRLVVALEEICPVREAHRARLPAVTHVDGSARLQTVRRETAPLYHAPITELGRRSGVPVVLDRSFDVQGEPVVESPVDAIRCDFSSELDALSIGPFVVTKRAAERRGSAADGADDGRGDGERPAGDPVGVGEVA